MYISIKMQEFHEHYVMKPIPDIASVLHVNHYKRDRTFKEMLIEQKGNIISPNYGLKCF